MNSSRAMPLVRRAAQSCRMTRNTARYGIPSIRSYYTRNVNLHPDLRFLRSCIFRTQFRTYATPTPSPSSSISPSSDAKSANELLEDLQDQYATARDEFEIATEETEKKTVYAADDREAARKEFDTLKEMFEAASQGPHGEEVKRRVGPRVRELENALKGLEIAALED